MMSERFKTSSVRGLCLALLGIALIAIASVLFGPFVWMQELSGRLGLSESLHRGVAVSDWPEAQAMQCMENQTSCAVQWPEHSLGLDVEPKELPALKPLVFTLTVAALAMDKASATITKHVGETGIEVLAAWLEGRDMFMGQHPMRVKGSPNGRGVELSGMIPVCVTGSEMVWRLTVQYKYKGEAYAAYADLRSISHNE